MAFGARARVVNPRLGTYFSIFAALFTALFLLVLIFEQLRLSETLLQVAFFAVPILIYAGIGLSVGSNDALNYFAAGRRVPAAYTGLLLAASALGGTFVVAGTGAFFFAGFDALVLLMGTLTGFVVMAIVLAPFYRKFGAFTVPSYLGRRFESRALRIVTAVVAAVPMLLVLSAELRIGAGVAGRLIALNPNLIVCVLALSVAITTAAGGKRSFTWAGVAQSIALFLALLGVVTTISVIVTNLPIPQLANGPMVRGLVRNETSEGLQLINVWPLAFDLPGEGFATLVKPYTQPFGAVGTLGFVIGTFAIAAGISAAPWLLPRVAASPSVYEARKALGWATVFSGLALLTISSVAIFMRDFALEAVISERLGPLPRWLYDAAAAHLVAFDQTAVRLGFSGLKFDRDGVLFALPIATGLPQAFTYMLLAGALAAALATAGSTMISLAAILGEDVVQGMSWEPVAPEARVWITRSFVGVVAVCGAALTMIAPTDPLRLVLWALSITGASLFPVMVLSIWWKRLTASGSIAGVVAGFAAAALAILLSEVGAIGTPSPIAGILGLPASFAVALGVSILRPGTSRHALEIVRDIRVPGGEVIYDRQMQRLELRKHART
ncbi:Na+/solute symporter [Hyphomicrobium denitrificans 1NES1]|uniref:Na+/solute symporter n=1 Tax=Hyphomicrobium denitrificans 1NES1 TaxID=670307 RepID=N0B107_9HYPH|nr:sodium:solute symporter [Hyphomicrobium denitrificans]AGK56603.1 Na+/solute symporter [Hyphomicrobium denitrificans 1NES1]